MKYETRPFIMLNDLEEMYDYSDENMTMLERGHRIPVPLYIDTIRLGYPVIDFSEGDHKDFPVLNNDPVRTLKGLLLQSLSVYFSSYPGFPSSWNILCLYCSTPGWLKGLTPST